VDISAYYLSIFSCKNINNNLKVAVEEGGPKFSK
jgi:hypothetical protein